MKSGGQYYGYCVLGKLDFKKQKPVVNTDLHRSCKTKQKDIPVLESGAAPLFFFSMLVSTEIPVC